MVVLAETDALEVQEAHSAEVVVDLVVVLVFLDGSDGSQVFQSAEVVDFVVVFGLEGSSQALQLAVLVATGVLEVLGSQLPHVGSA